MNNLNMYTNKELKELKGNDYIHALLHNMDKFNELEAKEVIEEKASSIRQALLLSEGKENKQKMRRKYQDIIMLDDEELIELYNV